MEVTINDREYELKELTKEEAKQYIGKEVYVWDLKTTYKRKLLEVFEPDCLNPFCILEACGKSTYYYPHCAPVPEEWYVFDLGKVVKGKRYHTTTTPSNFGVVDHGSKEYCKQKARELNDKEMSCSECTHEDEPMAVCSDCGKKSKFKRKETSEETNEESAEHPLTYYELTQLLKCFGVEHYFSREVIPGTICYNIIDENKVLSNGYKIRYKHSEWMPATRETVFKWWSMESGNSDISRFVSFMEWDV